jgi:hypothetical protein
MDLLQTQNTAKTAREIAKLSELEQKINALKLEDQTKFGRGEDVSSIVKNDDINSIARDQSRLRDLRRGGSGVLSGESPLEADIETENSGEIERLEKKKHEIETGLIRRENRAFSLSSQKDEMKAELNRLVDEANEAIERANERGE